MKMANVCLTNEINAFKTINFFTFSRELLVLLSCEVIVFVVLSYLFLIFPSNPRGSLLFPIIQYYSIVEESLLKGTWFVKRRFRV